LLIDLLVIVFPLLVIVLVIGAAQRRFRRARALSQNLLITAMVLVLMLVGGELFFRTTYAESDGLPTLAVNNWLRRYWQTNTLGYRDAGWTPADWEGKTTVIAVGDSLTAGWGIDDPAQRWTGVLQSHLGAGALVINIGKPSTTTVDQRANLMAYPLQTPDVVIWQYTLNDIEHAALSIGQNPNLDPLGGVPFWAQTSYLGNFVYWRTAGVAARGGGVYADWLHRMYDTPTVWDIHRTEILAAIDTVQSMDARLIPVIFPDMPAPFASIGYVDRVAQVFAERGYDALKLFDQAEAMPASIRMVSVRDAHPSAAFSQVVGDALYERYFAPSP